MTNVKVALLLADGFEEIEALTVVDVLRRAEISIDTFGLSSQVVTGSHHIAVTSDKQGVPNVNEYDMIILPGGMPGSVNLSQHEGVLEALRQFHQQGKYIGAICAAPRALEAAGILNNKSFTCYDGVETIAVSGHYQKQTVVVDHNLMTSRGAGTALHFAYGIVELLIGFEASRKLQDAMLFSHTVGEFKL